MRYHDFQLSGYDVRQFGAEIVLHLELAGEQSHIRFADIELYDFTHTGGTIIFGIEEIPVSQILDQFWERILHSAQEVGGVPHWDHDDRHSYQRKLEADGLRAWEISSSIGFTGFVIAKSIEDVTDKFAKTA